MITAPISPDEHTQLVVHGKSNICCDQWEVGNDPL